VRAIRFIVAALISALTWVVPITFMILMACGCENDARQFGLRVATHYAHGGEDAAVAMASADRHAVGNRAVSFERGALVVVSVVIPLALHPPSWAARSRWVSMSRKRSRRSSPSRWSSLSASPRCAADIRPRESSPIPRAVSVGRGGEPTAQPNLGSRDVFAAVESESSERRLGLPGRTQSPM
jgi:hypothetical protein